MPISLACRSANLSKSTQNQGWVEHDPMEIWATQSSTLVEVLAKADISSDQIAAIGITNQRETTIVWEKKPASLSITPLSGSAVVPQKSASI